jgi:hypothetical protein
LVFPNINIFPLSKKMTWPYIGPALMAAKVLPQCLLDVRKGMLSARALISSESRFRTKNIYMALRASTTTRLTAVNIHNVVSIRRDIT